ncbi:metalloendopeptidase [Coemansia biformis]|uniref:Metalloendopeptidase n=1 Tax=Coemansia biformis TaxID=1286918 RepID=A0A9W7YFF1_9FUNG|nr:metalloendopeptidase [Coemansia biformis]
MLWRLRAAQGAAARLARGIRGRQLQTYRRFGSDRQPIWQERWFQYTAGAAGTAGAVYVAVHTRESPTGRWQFISVTPEDEEREGQQAYRMIMQQYRSRILPRGSPADTLVRRVAQRLLEVAQTRGNWEVHVIDSPERNAFVLPGGKIFVFSGLLPVAMTEDGLATVLAHEIAHQQARHTGEKLSQARLLHLAYLFVALFVDSGAAQIGRSMTSLLLELPNSRRCEEEADQIGLQLMATACYDPAQAVALWERMRAAEGVSPPEFLNTHPSTESRIVNIRKWVPDAELKREAADCPSPGLLHDFARFGSGQDHYVR